MYIQLEFCSLRFVSPAVCVIAVSAGQHVTTDNAYELISLIQEKSQQPLFLIIDRSASYTYDPNAILVLKNSDLFESICIVVSNVAQRRLAIYENMITNNDLKIFPSLPASLLYCHELAQNMNNPNLAVVNTKEYD